MEAEYHYARDPDFSAARAKRNVSSRTAHRTRGIGMERSAWTTVSQIVLDETGGCRLLCISYMAGSFAMYFTQAKICFICLGGALLPGARQILRANVAACDPPIVDVMRDRIELSDVL